MQQKALSLSLSSTCTNSTFTRAHTYRHAYIWDGLAWGEGPRALGMHISCVTRPSLSPPCHGFSTLPLSLSLCLFSQESGTHVVATGQKMDANCSGHFPSGKQFTYLFSSPVSGHTRRGKEEGGGGKEGMEGHLRSPPPPPPEVQGQFLCFIPSCIPAPSTFHGHHHRSKDSALPTPRGWGG